VTAGLRPRDKGKGAARAAIGLGWNFGPG